MNHLERDDRKLVRSKKIMIRYDNEQAIRAPVNKVADLRTSKTLIENALVDDSRATGRAERAEQTLEKQVRVVKVSTKNFSWLVMHVADVSTKCQIKSDGRTAYERIKGHRYTATPLSC